MYKRQGSSRILDWGVGCGRIIRYFIEDGYKNARGIDIDQFNIDWCKENLPKADFARCEFDPPTKFDNDTFELIYAHSVLTHLGLEDEEAWLTELNRILSPTGIGCVTFTSEFGTHLIHNAHMHSEPEFWTEFWNTGRIDFGEYKIGVDKGRAGYYRTVAQTQLYVLSVWSQKIDIIKIIPGFANNQDAVIFRKKEV